MLEAMQERNLCSQGTHLCPNFHRLLSPTKIDQGPRRGTHIWKGQGCWSSHLVVYLWCIATILNHSGLIWVMCKEKVLFWCQHLNCNLNHYSSNLIVRPSTLIDLLKGFYYFYPTSFHLPFIGSYPSLQGNKGITVTFQLHLPHGRKERKQQCKVRFDKIISTSININTDNVALQSFTPFWKAKKKTLGTSLLDHSPQNLNL